MPRLMLKRMLQSSGAGVLKTSDKSWSPLAMSAEEGVCCSACTCTQTTSDKTSRLGLLMMGYCYQCIETAGF